MGSQPSAAAAPRVVGRYALFDAIASGGMATVHFGRIQSVGGFSRTVAIKRLHPHLASEPEFVAMLLDEARMAARVHHPNVVDTLDIVADEGEMFIVMEYVHGESLAGLLKRCPQTPGEPPLPVAVAIVASALHGLHAAHDAKNETGEPLNIVHRDVSPQNILVGADGHARVLDFGVAKAVGRLQTTQEGRFKGKLAYMAPEQLSTALVDRRADVYAAAVVLWETITRRRLFRADSEAVLMQLVLAADVQPPSRIVPGLPSGLDDIVMRGLAREPGDRFETAREMASALERCVMPALSVDVGEWVARIAADSLSTRAARVADIERSGSGPSSAQAPISDVATSTGAALVTDSKGDHAGAAAKRRPWIWGGAGAALVVVALGGLLFTKLRHAPAPAAAATTASPAATTSTAEAPSASASAVPSASAAASASADVPPPAPPPPTVRRAATPPAAPAVDCTHPIVIDPATGHHIYKRECLHR
ncbi:MAG TPA: serine/threonine-protein kinase [Polyangiaceae bacterium]